MIGIRFLRIDQVTVLILRDAPERGKFIELLNSSIARFIVCPNRDLRWTGSAEQPTGDPAAQRAGHPDQARTGTVDRLGQRRL
jgi:hypothetical protein